MRDGFTNSTISQLMLTVPQLERLSNMLSIEMTSQYANGSSVTVHVIGPVGAEDVESGEMEGGRVETKEEKAIQFCVHAVPPQSSEAPWPFRSLTRDPILQQVRNLGPFVNLPR